MQLQITVTFVKVFSSHACSCR